MIFNIKVTDNFCLAQDENIVSAYLQKKSAKSKILLFLFLINLKLIVLFKLYIDFNYDNCYKFRLKIFKG